MSTQLSNSNNLFRDLKIAYAINIISGKESKILEEFNIFNAFFVIVLLNVLIIWFDIMLKKKARQGFFFPIEFLKLSLSVIRLILAYLFITASRPLFGIDATGIITDPKNIMINIIYFIILIMITIFVSYISLNENNEKNEKDVEE